MNTLSFTYQDRPVRTAGTPDAPLFVAADVCRVLELGTTAKALERLDEDEKGVSSVHTLGGPQEMFRLNPVFTTEQRNTRSLRVTYNAKTGQFCSMFDLL